MRQFQGLSSYHRCFIPGFTAIAHPLHTLTQKGAEFLRTRECQESFDTLKEKLGMASVLVYPSFDRPFVLETDASITGIVDSLNYAKSCSECAIVTGGGRLHRPLYM